MRQHERVPATQSVTVRFADRNTLHQAYLKDISRGGLFAATDKAFTLRDQIQITISVEHGGELVLHGEVVHVVTQAEADQWQGDAGIGVQFTDLDDDKRDALESYLDGMLEKLGLQLEEVELDTRLLEEIEKGARLGRLHDVLGVDLKADSTEVAVAAEMRSLALATLEQQAQDRPDLCKRISEALKAVHRSLQLLADSQRRAIYLFKTALVSPVELAQMVEKDREVRQEIERIWEQSFPSQAAASHRLAELALRTAKERDFKSARKSAQIALTQNPFLFELRDAMKTWGD